MPKLTLHSSAVPLQVEAVLADLLVDPGTPEILRPAPGVRGTELTDIAASIFIISSAAANVTTLLLAKDRVEEFADRLLGAMRRSGRDSVELSAHIDGTKTSVRISTSDPEMDLVQTLSRLIRAIDPEPEIQSQNLLERESNGPGGDKEK